MRCRWGRFRCAGSRDDCKLDKRQNERGIPTWNVYCEYVRNPYPWDGHRIWTKCYIFIVDWNRLSRIIYNVFDFSSGERGIVNSEEALGFPVLFRMLLYSGNRPPFRRCVNRQGLLEYL